MEQDKLFSSSDIYFTLNETTQKLESHLDYEDYLYRSISEKTPFIIYEEELKRLNDYLVFLLENSIQQKQEEIDWSNIIVPDGNFISDGEIELAKDEVRLKWSFNINQTLFSTGITMLLSFLESCLSEIAQWQDPLLDIKKIKGNKMEKYFHSLNRSLNTQLVLPKQIQESRKIRNKFIHNQLQSNEVHKKELRYTIDAVVNLLFELENAMIENGKL
ncbi:hypothetical protein [Oceanobacillus jeddahense]|uniref:hypothetical protein n=1 Tax=Oceanobacillus jeddahense TaxID=1462527 RepID=UPI00362BEA05